ncbi:hypothetical protein TWF694_000422 [Orbilia ellipsospora]|uniref:Adenylate kinase n=1 Tax=Orbilia ellipsospora TaxID=2528407 RepID=A0AAV9XNI4_9PEZI
MSQLGLQSSKPSIPGPKEAVKDKPVFPEDGIPRTILDEEERPVSLVNRVLEDNNAMTVDQAFHILNSSGLTRDEILKLNSSGLEDSMEQSYDVDGVPDEFQGPEDKDMQEIISILSQPNWGPQYESFKLAQRSCSPVGHLSHLEPMTRPIAYNDLDSNFNRYAHHMRPKITIPPYKPMEQNPTTLQVETDPAKPGFKNRDPAIIIVYLVGPPCSGKTTVAKAICDKFNFKYIGVAEVLQRERKNSDSPYKQVLENMLAKGLLGPYKMVPSILISEIIKEMERGFKQVFLIDGFPRGIDRAVYFEEMMQPCDFVFYLKCSDKIAFERMMAAGLENGEDVDSEEFRKKAEKQLEVYEKEAALVIDYYTRQGKVTIVDAELSMEDVQKQVDLKVKDTLIDGFVGRRKEIIDENNRKTWERIRESIERQWIRNEVFGSQDMMKVVPDGFDTDSDVDMEEGGVSLEGTSYGDAPIHHPQLNSLRNGSGGPQGGPVTAARVPTSASTSETDSSMTDNSMLVKNAGKTPGRAGSHPRFFTDAIAAAVAREEEHSYRPRTLKKPVSMKTLGSRSSSDSSASQKSDGGVAMDPHDSETLERQAKKIEKKRSISEKFKNMQDGHCHKSQQ